MTEQNAATGGVQTDGNDWRVTVQLTEGSQVGRAIEHLNAHSLEGDVRKRLGGRVVVGTDGGAELFLYTHTQDAAAAAQQAVAELLAGHGIKGEYTVQRWHPVAEEWEAAGVAMPQSEAQIRAERKRLDEEETGESLAAGHALFEVRVQVPTHRDAMALAARLAAEHYPLVRRWRFLVVGANNADQAEEFAARIRRQAPSGAVVSIEEVGPSRPYTVFELAAGSGL